MVKEKTFVVFRQKDSRSQPSYERYSIPLTKGMTVLEALFYIQNHLDSSLAFRYDSCL